MLDEFKFLIVDDDIAAAEGTKALLKKLGAVQITLAFSGTEAFQHLSKKGRPFDCVISDVQMPMGTGLQLLYQIRTSTIARTFRPDMSVVLMSGVASSGIASVARQLDANAFLVKPFSIHALQSAVVTARRRAFALDQQRYAQIHPVELQVH